MFNISENVANVIYSISNYLVILGAFGAFLGAFGSIWSGTVRDKFESLREAEFAAKVAGANEGAAKANEGLAKAVTEQEKIRQANLELALQLEEEKANRSALEFRLKERLPRFGEKVRDALKPFKPIDVILETARDSESVQASKNLAGALEYAGWKLVEWWFIEGKIQSGFWAKSNEPGRHFPLSGRTIPEDERTVAARNAVVDWLKKNKYQAHGLYSYEELPADTVLIQVGPSERLENPGSIRFNMKDIDGNPVENVLTKGPQDKPTKEEK